MRSFIGLIALFVVVGCASRPAPPAIDPDASSTVLTSTGPRHPVTARMKSVTDKLAEQPASDFSLPGLDGRPISLKSLRAQGPVLLYAIKEGCPCSTDFEPFANAFSKRYKDKATVVGLYNEDLTQAKKWAEMHSTAHPIALDLQLEVCRAYKLERSVYVVIINQKGVIEAGWAGYSKEMLLDADTLLQALTGQSLPPFDTLYAPTTPASGCQLFEGEGFAPGDVR